MSSNSSKRTSNVIVILLSTAITSCLTITTLPKTKQQTYHHAELSGLRQAQNLVIGSPAATPTTTLPSVELPDFEEPIGNHTVALGRDAQLSCKINNLGNFRTAWLRVEDKGILTIHNNIITRNYRIGLVNNDDEGTNFKLTIRNVQPSDKGGYMCQINSVPMKYAIGYLDVLTPPFFDDMPLPSTLTSSSQVDGSSDRTITTTQTPPGAGIITVVEGANATLSCHANGHPAPVITWRREDNEPILLNGASTLDGVQKVESSSISLQSVSRLNSGAYLCIASNGVQPSVSKRQVLDVQFSPVVRLPQTEIGASLKQAEARLTCHIELNPLGTYHWVKLNSQHSNYQRQTAGNEDDLWLIENEELINSDKFEIVIKQVNSEKVQMILNIRHIERADFAWYKCIAKNSLAIQSSSIRLYESSSFSLNNMFRGSLSSGEDRRAGSQFGLNPDQHQQQQQQQQQQNDEQQDGSTNARRGSILSRAHTRSSWTQRGGSSSRQQEPTNALLDAASSAASSPANLLIFNSYSYHLIVLLLIGFIFLA